MRPIPPLGLLVLVATSLFALTCAPASAPPVPVFEQKALQELLAAPRLRYLFGSTAKVEQVIGDIDNQTKQPTNNQTSSRYSVLGTDLGNSFEHNGKAYFLFGDVVGRDGMEA